MSEDMAALRELLSVQGEHGNWNYSPYMHGLHTGLALAVACMTGWKEDPAYLDEPLFYLGDVFALSPDHVPAVPDAA